MNRRTKARLKAYTAQRGLCFWCGDPTRDRRISNTRHGREATAEHLLPVRAGGTDAQRNIVSACSICNTHRGHMPLAMWLLIVRETLTIRGRAHHFREVLSSLRERGIHAVTQVGHPGNGPDTQTAKVPPPTDMRPAP